MRPRGARRALHALVALVLALGGGFARAQTLQITTPTFPAPVTNAVTHGTPSSISLDVANGLAGTRLREIQFRLAPGYTAQGGLGPPGWTITKTTVSRAVKFVVTDCGQNGIQSGQTGRFRLDVTPPNDAVAGDVVDDLTQISTDDPCGGPKGWSVTSPGSVAIPRKTLRMTATASPASGPAPLAATATYTVTNLTSQAQGGITLSPTVIPGTGWTSGGCAPATLSLAAAGAAGSTGTITCSYALTSAPQSYAIGGTAVGAGASGAGVSAGTIQVADATATFAFDSLSAGNGDTVRATLSVRNETATAIDVTPPAFSALLLQNLVRAPGAPDPAAASVAPGASQDFVYTLTVTGLVGAPYVAHGTASTTAGQTNLAITPAGTIASARVEWSPPAVVTERAAAPYRFTVTVTNFSPGNVGEVQIVNPQRAVWAGLRETPGASSPLTFQQLATSGSTDTLHYTGTLAPGGTATLAFEFTAVPTVTQTTFYPFEVVVIPSVGGTFTTAYPKSIASAEPIPDVAQPSILSNAGGHVISWVNTGRADAPHDGVVVFRTPAPGVPTVPADFVDYSVPANRPADYFFDSRDGSPIDTLADPTPGTFHYRICNRDALFVYSSCTTGFWNGAGWIDSAVPPPGGWTHQLGGSVLLLPGVVPGNRVGVATNRPSIAVLDMATGNRSFDPLPLAALPSSNTPAARLANGRLVLFAADNSGTVTALDAELGTLYWAVTKPGEAFVAGVSGILRQYAAQAFRDAYPGDILLLPSTTGRVLAVDAATGATLWTVTAGADVRATVTYDPATNRFFVPTNGAGIVAYDLGTSSPSSPPSPAAGWANPGGTYRFPCSRSLSPADLACIDSAGLLRIVAKSDGAVKVSFATGVSSPSTLWPVGAGAAPGFVVSNATRVQRLQVGGAPLAASILGEWIPGLTLSPVLVLASSGTIVVGASDKKLHKLSLANASDTGVTAAITPEPASVFLGAPAYDVTNGTFVLGTSDGRVWAVKSL